MSRHAGVLGGIGVLAACLVPLLGCPGVIFIYNGAFGGQIAVVGCVGTCSTIDRSLKPVRLVLVHQGDVVTGQMFVSGRATNVTGHVSDSGQLTLDGDLSGASIRDWKSSLVGSSMRPQGMEGTFSSLSVDSRGLATRIDFKLVNVSRE